MKVSTFCQVIYIPQASPSPLRKQLGIRPARKAPDDMALGLDLREYNGLSACEVIPMFSLLGFEIHQSFLGVVPFGA